MPKISPDVERLRRDIDREWSDSILDCLQQFVRIPNLSPAFDADWQAHGHMQRAVELIASWCRTCALPGARVAVRELPGLTPLLTVDVPGERPGCVLLYGHLDKQPPFTGWLPGLAAFEPVIRDGKLYGRGAADDGYAAFSSLTAIAALKAQGIALPRCLLLIEASEESGSIHLPAHLDAMGRELGTPSLVVCLDAECGNYDQLWSTTSLRGNLTGTLRVRLLTEGVHSGMATGIAATPFRIAEQLLARIENPLNADLLLEELQAAVPADRRAQIALAARVLGASVAGKLPFAPGARPVSDDPVELLINSTWRATLAVTGADGLPAIANAGNVLLPEIALKLSLRLPPAVDAVRAQTALKRTLERDPPYGAQVSFETDAPTGGWNAPPLAPWLEQAIHGASQQIFGREAVHVGCGGTIPFMGMLGERFPHTQFLITGVLGPHANAHGPNEFLHIDYTRRITACVALVLAALP
ncbi:MAG TPA: M20/M25/M40 family metallo-hydrolase [Steroidobacteraceae bacterium]|nr:M20/M25/M40 family metallo-hydrolase [Steroidobacteraceae bacterium]